MLQLSAFHAAVNGVQRQTGQGQDPAGVGLKRPVKADSLLETQNLLQQADQDLAAVQTDAGQEGLPQGAGVTGAAETETGKTALPTRFSVRAAVAQAGKAPVAVQGHAVHGPEIMVQHPGRFVICPDQKINGRIAALIGGTADIASEGRQRLLQGRIGQDGPPGNRRGRLCGFRRRTFIDFLIIGNQAAVLLRISGTRFHAPVGAVIGNCM